MPFLPWQNMPAIGAIKYFNEQNIAIPEQIAVMGFSNWKISGLITPSLSTVNQPGESMGKKHLNYFIKSYNFQKTKKIQHQIIELETSLVIRGLHLKIMGLKNEYCVEDPHISHV